MSLDKTPVIELFKTALGIPSKSLELKSVKKTRKTTTKTKNHLNHKNRPSIDALIFNVNSTGTSTFPYETLQDSDNSDTIQNDNVNTTTDSPTVNRQDNNDIGIVSRDLLIPIIQYCESDKASSSSSSCCQSILSYVYKSVKPIMAKKTHNETSHLQKKLYILNELLQNSVNFRNTLLLRTSELNKLIESVGQFSNSSMKISSTDNRFNKRRYSLCYYFEIWFDLYNSTYPQLQLVNNFFIKKYNFNLLSQRIHQKLFEMQHLENITQKNLILAKCSKLIDTNNEKSSVIENTLIELKDNCNILKRLFHILFPFHAKLPEIDIISNSHNRSTNVAPNSKQETINPKSQICSNSQSDNCKDQYVWENSDDESFVYDSDKDNEESKEKYNNAAVEDDDKHTNLATSLTSSTDICYDDIAWEEGIANESSKNIQQNTNNSIVDDEDESSDRQHKRIKSMSQFDINASDQMSLIQSLGCTPHSIEITFSTETTQLQTEDNKIIMEQAIEIAKIIKKFTLPKINNWIDILNQSIGVMRSDESTNKIQNTNQLFSKIETINNSEFISNNSLYKFNHSISKLNNLLQKLVNVSNVANELLSGKYHDLLFPENDDNNNDNTTTAIKKFT